MSAEQNATLVRTLIDEFSRGDLAAVATHFAPDAVWELPGRGVLAGEYKGPDAIIGFLARSFELSGGTLRLQVMDVLAGQHGVDRRPGDAGADLRRHHDRDTVGSTDPDQLHLPDLGAVAGGGGSARQEEGEQQSGGEGTRGEQHGGRGGQAPGRAHRGSRYQHRADARHGS